MSGHPVKRRACSSSFVKNIKREKSLRYRIKVMKGDIEYKWTWKIGKWKIQGSCNKELTRINMNSLLETK